MLLISLFVAAAGVLSFYYRPLAFFIAVSAILLLCFRIFVKHNFKSIVSLLAILLFAISLLNTYKRVDLLDSFSGKAVNITLTATANSYGDNGNVVIPAVVTGGELPRGTRLQLKSYNSVFVAAGDVFNAKASVYSLKYSKYRRYNFSNGIYCNSRLEVLSGTVGTNRFYSAMQAVRDYVTDILFSNMDYKSAATLNAITTGDKAYLSDSFAESIRLTGVSHVMVVSGQHLAIIMESFFCILDKLYYNRYLRLAASTALGFFMISICGFTVSIVRAALMFFVSAAAPLFYRERDSLSSLSAAVFIILLLTPFAVFSVSFQLSVLATLGIVAVSPAYTSLLSGLLGKVGLSRLEPAVNIIINTLAATVMTLPVLIGTFGTVSLVSVLTNLLITYAVTGALTFTAAAILFSPLPPVFHLFNLAAALCAKYMNWVISRLSQLSFTAVSIENAFVKNMLLVITVLLIVSVLLSVTALNKKERLNRLKEALEGSDRHADTIQRGSA